MSVEFSSGKAFVTTKGGTVEVEYEIDGEMIVLHHSAGDLVLTLNSDGTLEGPLGKMKRKDP